MKKRNIRKVVYRFTQGGAEDVFWCSETKKMYIRQPVDESKVHWLTSSKWTGGYEAESHIRDGITMQVVDKCGKILFEETLEQDEWNFGTSALKIGDFANEAIEKTAKEFGKGLKNYEEWKNWLLSDKKLYDSIDSNDTWLYYLNEHHTKIVGEKYFLGKKALLAEEHCKHKVSNKEWVEYLVISEDKCYTLDIAGYAFE